ncbi:SAVED domain-containing protein [Actinomadura sp. B10D3]|uniref:SAVED domain-containing protein n=1 Tax=Actinomadura sp. B10D3 TaxID=3153557 RepID=UPI00325E6089
MPDRRFCCTRFIVGPRPSSLTTHRPLRDRARSRPPGRTALAPAHKCTISISCPAAFRFGARLGHTHGSDIVVHGVRQRSPGAFFPATVLGNSATPTPPSAPPPLVVEAVETFAGGDPSATALALDVQGLGARFTAPVRQACKERGIGNLLLIRNPETFLEEDRKTFTACVEQICRAWADAGLSEAARNGGHSVFLSGPAAVAVAVGARFANNQPSRWTTYTFDDASSTYEPLS